jgi:hypothetical protein
VFRLPLFWRSSPDRISYMYGDFNILLLYHSASLPSLFGGLPLSCLPACYFACHVSFLLSGMALLLSCSLLL